MQGSFLAALPSDVLDIICIHYLSSCPASILDLGATARDLRHHVCRDQLWQALFLSQFGVLIRLYWAGVAPLPTFTWLRHYKHFALHWLKVTSERGVVLTCVHGSCYDVTAFVDDHPGDPTLLLSASGVDCTAAFEYVEHSRHAMCLLRAMAVPELDDLIALSSSIAEQRVLWELEAARSSHTARDHGAGEGMGAHSSASSLIRGARRWLVCWLQETLQEVYDILCAQFTGDPGPTSWRRRQVMQMLGGTIRPRRMHSKERPGSKA